jgi:hypothetical protein
MSVSVEDLKRTWESIFERKGGNGVYTRLFDSLSPGQQSALLGALRLRETELPVIGSLRGPDSWLILTTQRLVWAARGEQFEVAVPRIRDAIADFRHLANSQSKLEMTNLQVTTLSGEEYGIELEPGPPLSGTWNVLKNLGARNRRASEDSSVSSS